VPAALRTALSEVRRKLAEVVARDKAAPAARLAAEEEERRRREDDEGEAVHATLGAVRRMAPLATLTTKPRGPGEVPGDVDRNNAAALAAAEQEDAYGGRGEGSSDTTSAARITQLLQQQKDISTQEIEEEKKAQAVLTAELAEMTALLKDATLQIHSSVSSQNVQLDSLQHHAVDNMEELHRQKKKMNEREKGMTKSVWASVGTIFWIVAMFVVTYAVIRLFPKP